MTSLTSAAGAVVQTAGTHLAFNPINANDWITMLGNYVALGVLLIVFAETGLMVGFFLPGDSLIFLAGLYTLGGKEGQPHLSLPLMLIGLPICAVVGAQLGHYLGFKFGRGLFDKPDSRLFKAKHIDKAEEVFYKYGPAKAIILARFIPVVRTFMNPVAGVMEVPAKKFFVYNVIGGVVWSVGVLLLGHSIGSTVSADKIDKYIIPITLLIVALSAIPIVVEVLKARREKRQGGEGGHGAQGGYDDRGGYDDGYTPRRGAQAGRRGYDGGGRGDQGGYGDPGYGDQDGYGDPGHGGRGGQGRGPGGPGGRGGDQGGRGGRGGDQGGRGGDRDSVASAGRHRSR